MRFSLTYSTSTILIAGALSSNAWAQLPPGGDAPAGGPVAPAASSPPAPPPPPADPAPAPPSAPPEAAAALPAPPPAEPAEASAPAQTVPTPSSAEPAPVAPEPSPSEPVPAATATVGLTASVTLGGDDDEDCDDDDEDCEDEDEDDEDCDDDDEDCDEDDDEDCDEDDDEDCDEDEDEDDDEPHDGPGVLFGDPGGASKFGGYYGFSMDSSWFGGRAGMVLGSEGGVILNHGLVLGGAARALWTPVEGPPLYETGAEGQGRSSQSSLAVAYGGFMMRFQMTGKGPFYASFGALIGAGGVTLLPRIGDTDKYLWRNDQDGNGFFVFEPSFQGHVNLTRWLRLTVNTSYRMVHGVDYKGLTERDLRGLSLGAALQVGWF